MPFVSTLNQFEGSFDVPCTHRVIFERDALSTGVHLHAMLSNGDTSTRSLAVLDAGLVDAAPDLCDRVQAFFDTHTETLELVSPPLVLQGGEAAKHGLEPVTVPVIEAIRAGGICRHSNVLAIGGGAFLDAAGLGASLAHRGVRLVRMPSTTLAQGDAGVGVKNGVNQVGVEGGKNLIGTFDVPAGVLNDVTLLTTLDDVHWRSGLAEAIKVALIMDADFLAWIEHQCEALVARDLNVMEALLTKTAQMHLRHITDGGDPFERTMARPLDFGHWTAHELESRSGWTVPHGEAVALGMCVDLRLGEAMGLTASGLTDRVELVLRRLGFLQCHIGTTSIDDLMRGLEHFRQHLGGHLTICMIEVPGRSIDIHTVDSQLAVQALHDVFDALPCG